MNHRLRTVLIGLAIVALVFGGVAVLWRTPCEADRKAALIRVGMTRNQVRELVGSDAIARVNYEMPFCGWDYRDGSSLHIDCTVPEPHRVERIQIFPPDSRTRLRRLRRTLARALPFLGE